MSGNRARTVYVGNLDEKVSERVLYEILIQAGRLVDLHIPRDKDTNRTKGFAFAEYETEEIADYAVRLFSGLVTLYRRTLKFAISGKDKPSQNLSSPSTPTLNLAPRLGSHHNLLNSTETSEHVSRFSLHQEPAPPGAAQPNSHGSVLNVNNSEYSRRVFGATIDSISRSNSDRKMYDSTNPIKFSPR